MALNWRLQSRPLRLQRRTRSPPPAKGRPSARASRGHGEPEPTGETEPAHIRVAARFRTTLPFARQLRESLDRLLLAATPSEGGEQ
jgi:hypothetical protein